MDVRYFTLTLLLATVTFAAAPRRDEQVQQAFAGLEPVSEEPTLAPVRESDVLLEPPAPAELGATNKLGVPSWLVGESAAALPVEVESAFELDRNPAPPSAKSVLSKRNAPAPRWRLQFRGSNDWPAMRRRWGGSTICSMSAPARTNSS